ncbi:MAG: hypothetical protein ABJA90_10290 [Ginsengibacter sp.]
MKILTGLFFAYILLVSAGCSQTYRIEKGFAYAREVISGVKSQGSVAEDGTILQTHRKPGMQYFIYVETKDTAFPLVKSIRIKGEYYEANAEAVHEFPVVLMSSGSTEKYDTLFRSASLITLKINVGEMIKESDIKQLSKFKNQDVVLGFLYKGNIHYYSIAKIKYLEALRLE